jgi:hypothetical protein
VGNTLDGGTADAQAKLGATDATAVIPRRLGGPRLLGGEKYEDLYNLRGLSAPPIAWTNGPR